MKGRDMSFEPRLVSQVLDKQCVAYHQNGCSDELLVILRAQGHPDVTRNDIVARAKDVIDAFGVLDPEKDKCYFCGKTKEVGTLCACFRHAFLT